MLPILVSAAMHGAVMHGAMHGGASRPELRQTMQRVRRCTPRCNDDRSSNLISSTLAWLDGWVIKEDLCPFAAAARRHTRVVVCYDEDVGAETALLASELQGLRDIEPTHPATTLVIFPQRQSFAALMELQSIAEALADASYEEAPVQVLAFHPHAVYSDCLDAADWSTRSPLPLLHLLRGDDVDRAEARWVAQHEPGAAPSIQERNQAWLRGRGYKECAAAAALAAGVQPW